MVELKTIINLEDVHLAQAMNYCETYNLKIGLLINFGYQGLQFKRVHNNKFKPVKEPGQFINPLNQGTLTLPRVSNRGPWANETRTIKLEPLVYPHRTYRKL